MSAVSDFMTTGSFWWGAAAGTVFGSIITSAANYISKHKSDTRTFVHDDNLEQAKADRELRKRNEEMVFAAATEYATICSEILMNAVDVRGVFNALRDQFNTKSGLDDPMAAQKFAFAATTTEDVKRLAGPFNRLKMTAPVELMTAATRVNASFVGLQATVTEPFARTVALKAAGDELDLFLNSFRTTYGHGEYIAADAQRDALSFMSTLKLQVEQFMEEAKTDMKAAGFRTTPWG